MEGKDGEEKGKRQKVREDEEKKGREVLIGKRKEDEDKEK